MQEFFNQYLAELLLFLVLGSQGVSALRSKLNGGSLHDMVADLSRKLSAVEQRLKHVDDVATETHDWHEPEVTDGGANQRFSWKFTRGEISALDQMPILLRQLLDEIRGLRRDFAKILNGGRGGRHDS